MITKQKESRSGQALALYPRNISNLKSDNNTGELTLSINLEAVLLWLILAGFFFVCFGGLV